MKKVLFSLIIPCYNHARFLSTCLDSILHQDFQDWEAIVVNDGSTDETREVLTLYTNRDFRIKGVHKPNGGLSSARNEGIRHAKGDYFIFLDADDFLLENGLKILASHIHEGDQFLGFSFKIFDFELRHSFFTKELKEEKVPFSSLVFYGNTGPVHSYCINRDLVGRIGTYFDENLKSAEDWDYWVRVGKTGAWLKQIPFAAVGYRFSPESMSKNPKRMFEACLQVIAKINFADSRIVKEVNQKLPDSGFNEREIVKNHFIQYLGIAIMQNPQEAVDWLKEVSAHYEFTFTPSDFSGMNNILTFRYQYTPLQLHVILKSIQPKFQSFFQMAGFSSTFSQLALYRIFYFHIKNNNRKKWGKCSTFLNWRLDQTIKSLEKHFKH